MSAHISVILPLYNEEKIATDIVPRLLVEEAFHEIIVVDGGSTDATVACVAAHPRVRLLHAQKGRARQMNAGADVATGDILLFLHADCHLPQGVPSAVSAALAHPTVCGGRFRIRFDLPGIAMRTHAFLSRFLFFSFGDQAFFVRRSIFVAMGAYREDVPFEDVDFFRRLRKRGRVHVCADKVLVSARRYAKVGPIKQKWINVFLLCAAAFRWDVEAYKKFFYPEIR